METTIGTRRVDGVNLLPDVVDFLACPHCGAGLAVVDSSLRCSAWHSFDVSRHGYVTLLKGAVPRGMGDSAKMVAARESFLGAGHFAPLGAEVAARAREAATAGPTGCVVDIGTGTGYYLALVLDRLPRLQGLGLDVSSYAVRRAARVHERVGAVRCDVWRDLPVRSGVAGLVINIFAPRNAAELHRVLQRRGSLLVASPTSRHLAELITPLNLLTVDELKQARLEHKLHPFFTPTSRTVSDFVMTLSRSDVEAAVEMGPSAWHKEDRSVMERLHELPDPVTVTASVAISVYRRRDTAIA